ncbi:unnamed protein product (macronuclear) [Paramecium tetraurelia]|uniref:ATP-dependent DNA ligase family profile domain-containing protein n=1 Tax=Paramecium tetraurelia TaxID=5888 RepID=A0CCG0_PARTE|nr:uncharacterized protein GSPATT00037262001 [Paramecium tetraurelia]CAK68477.1 unnamed protein product [Paramecium tetraurelia]|eukprot:XP_001435874.1 hypothetical protein (macronuclear) [Paramecium tetraurelia strain d4-2]
MKKQQSPEMYLIKNDQFWHCQFISLKPITIQIRNGFLNGNLEQQETIEISLTKFPTMERGIEVMSDQIQQKLHKGFREINSNDILKANEQQFQEKMVATSKKDLMQQKILKKVNLPEQRKPVVALTDDATQGKLVGEWPKYRARTHFGETLDLGPPGDTKPIACLLAGQWNESINPTNYLLSEKLDGMRIIWSGCEMFTRTGNSLNFPTSFVEGWPTTYLDGELWLDRGQFQKLVSIAKKKQSDYKAWKDIKFMVFDAPLLDEPFVNRYSKLKKAIEKIKNPHLVYVPHVVCRGYEHLKEELALAQQAGGEGLMLRDPSSIYEGKRSNTLLKVKTTMDSEATVIDHISGMGKFKDQLGALKVQTDAGITFQIGVGFNSKLRKDPPKIGSRVSYTYYGLTDDGKPRFPVFERIREDI